MKKNQIIVLAGVILLAVLVFCVIRVSVHNNEQSLRNQVVAEKLVYETNYDKMFKVIAQIAQIPGAAEKTFNDIYPDLIKGRYSGQRGGALMSWISESNPSFDFSLYEKLADAIEAN